MIIESHFKPAWWMRNAHMQTILPRFLRRKLKPPTIDETFELPDGDFVELSWSEPPQDNTDKPLVVLFHGLGGSINSFYASGMMRALTEKGWTVVLMHFRGCGKQTNRHARAYHSGETGDAKAFIEWLKDKYPERPLAAIGFSLGGNMLAKYLGETGKDSLLDAAVVISAPLRLAPCAKRINTRFSKVYQKYLLDMLKQALIDKVKHLKHSFPLKLGVEDIKAIKSMREFDQRITGPLHGFDGADDYYTRCSGVQFLHNVQTPTLIIHSADDPFMTPQVHPAHDDLSNFVSFELSRRGGHVGFIHGRNPLKPKFWLEQRAPEFIQSIWKQR